MSTPVLFGQLCIAEFVKLQSRPIARAGWVVLALLGVAVVGAMAVLGGLSFEVNGQPTPLDAAPVDGVLASLVVRNFFISQTLIVLLGATIFASELSARTLREDLLRPVPRWMVLAAKWAALASWTTIGLVLQLLVAVAASFLFLSAESSTSWSTVMQGHAATLVAEVSFGGFVLMVAVLMRSLVGTVASVFVALLADRLVWVALYVGTFLRDVPEAGAMSEAPNWVNFLPWVAWGVGTQIATGYDPVLATWAVLVLVTVVAMVTAERVFSVTDVP